MIFDMIQKIFTADDYGKFKDGDNLILNSGINRISVMVNRGTDFSGLAEKTLGLHADFGGENLADFFMLMFRRKYVKQQLEQQIEKFIKIFGKVPNHLDTHRYLHLHPFLFSVFLNACDKYKIPYLRITRKGVVKISNMTSLIVHGMVKMDNLFYGKRIDKFVEADYFLSLDWYKKLDFKIPDAIIKVIYHPENDYNLLKQLQNKNEEKN